MQSITLLYGLRLGLILFNPRINQSGLVCSLVSNQCTSCVFQWLRSRTPAGNWQKRKTWLHLLTTRQSRGWWGTIRELMVPLSVPTTHSQSGRLQTRHWGRTVSPPSSCPAGAAGGQGAASDRCIWTSALALTHLDWRWPASRGSRGCCGAPQGRPPGCRPCTPGKQDGGSLSPWMQMKSRNQVCAVWSSAVSFTSRGQSPTASLIHFKQLAETHCCQHKYCSTFCRDFIMQLITVFNGTI